MQSQRQWKLETVLMLGAGLMLSFSVGTILAIALPKVLPSLSKTTAQFYSSIISALAFQGAMLVLTCIFLRQNETGWGSFLGLDHPQLGRVVLRALAVTALVLPMALMVLQVSQALLDHFRAKSELQPALKIIQISASPAQLVYAGALAILVAPVAEEVFFRGILYPTMKQLGWQRTGLVVSSLFFGFIHGHPPSFLALSFLGFVLALLYDRTSSLLAPILAHSSFNVVNFVMFLYNQRAGG